MRILLTPFGSHGDVYPLVGLGVALQRRGHEVTLLASTYYSDLARRTGLRLIGIGTPEQFTATLRNPELWHPTRAFKHVMEATAQSGPEIIEQVRRWNVPGESLLVASSVAFSPRIAAEAIGLPAVTVHYSPTVFRTNYQVPIPRGATDLSGLPTWAKRLIWRAVDRFMLDAAAGPPINSLRASVGLPPLRRIFRSWVHAPLMTIAMFPDWFAPAQPDWPAQTRQTGFPLFDEQDVSAIPDALESLLSRERPVVFTPGSAMAHGRAFFDTAIAACARMGRPAVLLTRFGENLPDALPPHAHHFAFAPLSRILGRCAAIVHHGGVGTTAAAFASGTPQLIMPMSHDQPDNAARVLRLGVGERVMPEKFTPDAVATKLGGLVDNPAVRVNCLKIAERCGEYDAINRTADCVEEAFSVARGERRAADLAEARG